MNEFESLERISLLVSRELLTGLTEEEATELQIWKGKHPEAFRTMTTWLNRENVQKGLKELDEVHEKATEAFIQAGVPVERQKVSVNRSYNIHFFKTNWVRYAAAILIMIGIGAYLWFNSKSLQHNGKMLVQGNIEHNRNADIVPGTNKAILTIGTQKTIDLSANKTGINVNRTISYNDGEKIAETDQMLQLTTPNGGQYQAALPDGSKIWLNAASSIRFPARFTGKTRTVEITGEAYLEITKNTKQPFIVNSNGTSIQVLGTSFNVNAYKDEELIKATLVEGSIKISTGKNDLVLHPGEQAQINGTNQISLISSSDKSIQAALAWKNGLFKFDNASIETIMRQLARWYDLEVIYEGKVTKTFLATIPRNAPISQVLEALEITKAVKFKIEGKKITVTP